MFVSDDGQYVVLITHERGVWLWEGDTGSSNAGRWHLLPAVCSNSVANTATTANPTAKTAKNGDISTHSYWTACFFSTPVSSSTMRLPLVM